MSNSVRSLKFLFLFVLVLFLAAPISILAAEITVKGRVFSEAGPLPDAKVYAYINYADLRNGTPPAATATTDNQGFTS